MLFQTNDIVCLSLLKHRRVAVLFLPTSSNFLSALYEAPDFPHLFSHHRLPPARILIWPFIASNLVSMSGHAARTHDVRCFIGCLLALHYTELTQPQFLFLSLLIRCRRHMCLPPYSDPFTRASKQAQLTPFFLWARMGWDGMGLGTKEIWIKSR